MSAENLAPWMRAEVDALGLRLPAAPPAAAVVIPCAGTDSGRVLLAGLRALAANNPGLAALLARARVEEVPR